MSSNPFSPPLLPSSPPPPQVVASVKAKTHGVIPLFLSQFLLLGAFAGGIAALIKLPESKWTTMTQVGGWDGMGWGWVIAKWQHVVG